MLIGGKNSPPEQGTEAQDQKHQRSKCTIYLMVDIVKDNQHKYNKRIRTTCASGEYALVVGTAVGKMLVANMNHLTSDL